MIDTVSGGAFLAATWAPLTSTVWLSFDETAISAAAGAASSTSAAASAPQFQRFPERSIAFLPLAALDVPARSRCIRSSRPNERRKPDTYRDCRQVTRPCQATAHIAASSA